MKRRRPTDTHAVGQFNITKIAPQPVARFLAEPTEQGFPAAETLGFAEQTYPYRTQE
jgi:hypothetical protein